jgi:hypothetical protein
MVVRREIVKTPSEPAGLKRLVAAGAFMDNAD